MGVYTGPRFGMHAHLVGVDDGYLNGVDACSSHWCMYIPNIGCEQIKKWLKKSIQLMEIKTSWTWSQIHITVMCPCFTVNCTWMPQLHETKHAVWSSQIWSSFAENSSQNKV